MVVLKEANDRAGTHIRSQKSILALSKIKDSEKKNLATKKLGVVSKNTGLGTRVTHEPWSDEVIRDQYEIGEGNGGSPRKEGPK